MNQKNKTAALFDVSIKVLLINKKGESLIFQARDDNPIFGGYSDLPGGRIDTDEIDQDFHQLLKRELTEEIGSGVKYKLRQDPVALAKGAFKPTANPLRDGKAFILFLGAYHGGEIIISDEHKGYAWKKLNRKNIEKLFHPILRQLISNYWRWNKK